MEILDKDSQNIGTYIVFGVVAVAYGLSIYYFLPLAMLSFNLALVLRIFFFILFGMLFGLSLLAFNVQRFLEIVLTHILLIFSASSTKQMVLKNLSAHRLRNKMTSIIYSISLGFIIFLIVSYNLQLKSAKLQQLQREGAYFSFTADDQTLVRPELFDPIIKKNEAIIDAFAYNS